MKEYSANANRVFSMLLVFFGEAFGSTVSFLVLLFCYNTKFVILKIRNNGYINTRYSSSVGEGNAQRT